MVLNNQTWSIAFAASQFLRVWFRSGPLASFAELISFVLNLLWRASDRVHKIDFKIHMHVSALEHSAWLAIHLACSFCIHLKKFFKLLENFVEWTHVLSSLRPPKSETKRVESKATSRLLVRLLLIGRHPCGIIYTSFAFIWEGLIGFINFREGFYSVRLLVYIRVVFFCKSKERSFDIWLTSFVVDFKNFYTI